MASRPSDTPRKPRTIPPLRASAASAAVYETRMLYQIGIMHREVVSHFKHQYDETPPLLAQDKSPTEALTKTFDALMKKWKKRFDELAKQMAVHFAAPIMLRNDKHLTKHLRDAGFTVKFNMTPTMRDAYGAVIEENVGLIRSIPEKYLFSVQGMVMRSVQTGRDIGALTRDLEKTYGVTRRRAAFIARDQNNKATAVFTRVRQEQIGATKAIWLHSGGGRHPRPEHVKFSGQEYDIRKGAYLEGKWVWPGTEINCRCVCRTVIPRGMK